MRAALSHRAFRRLLAGLAASQAGDWLYNVALLGFVYERTHSTLWLSVTTAARVLPVVVLGPIGGMIADRFDRRQTMIICDLLRAVLMLALLAVASMNMPIVLAPVLAGLATAAGAPYPACAAASTPRLVPDEDLPGANAARAVVGPLCVIGGPALGALLLAVSSANVAFLVNASSFVVSALFVASIPAGAAFRPLRRDGGPAHLLREIGEGAAALWAHRPAFRLVTADILCSFVYGVDTVALLLVSRRLGLGAHGYGMLLAAFGAGGVIGSALAVRAARSPHPRRIIAAALVAVAVPVPLLAVTPMIAAALVCAAVSGGGSMVVEILTETALQRGLDESVFARAYGFAFPVSIAGIALGSAIAAPLIAVLGLTGALVAVSAVVIAFAVRLILPERTRLSTRVLATA
ncbi:MAG: transporter [Pseudonocardiales bacterium]|nr:transporter [Pseudonocardiales bacterium]